MSLEVKTTYSATCSICRLRHPLVGCGQVWFDSIDDLKRSLRRAGWECKMSDQWPSCYKFYCPKHKSKEATPW